VDESKKAVKTYGNEEACLIFNDTVIEKPYTDADETVSWYYDYKTGGSVIRNKYTNDVLHAGTGEKKCPAADKVADNKKGRD
jgi:5-methylthioribose kinase